MAVARNNNFEEWTVDPLFHVAEEVQDSADRLHSAFHAWRRASSSSSSPHHHHHHHHQNSSIATTTRPLQSLRHDLCTALSIVEWQLDEFEKAAALALHERRRRRRLLQQLPESAPYNYPSGSMQAVVTKSDDEFEEELDVDHERRQQFVVAIRSQIATIRNAFHRDDHGGGGGGGSEEAVTVQCRPSVVVVHEDDDSFSRFLSGQLGDQYYSRHPPLHLKAAATPFINPPHVDQAQDDLHLQPLAHATTVDAAAAAVSNPSSVFPSFSTSISPPQSTDICYSSSSIIPTIAMQPNFPPASAPAQISGGHTSISCHHRLDLAATERILDSKTTTTTNSNSIDIPVHYNVVDIKASNNNDLHNSSNSYYCSSSTSSTEPAVMLIDMTSTNSEKAPSKVTKKKGRNGGLSSISALPIAATRMAHWAQLVVGEAKHSFQYGISKHALKQQKDGDHHASSSASSSDVAATTHLQQQFWNVNVKVEDDEEETRRIQSACFYLRPLLRRLFSRRLPGFRC